MGVGADTLVHPCPLFSSRYSLRSLQFRSRAALALEILASVTNSPCSSRRHQNGPCTPQELTTSARRSCGYRLETILMVQSAEDWRRDDAMTTTNLMAA